MQPDDGYFVVAGTCSWILQLLH